MYTVFQTHRTEADWLAMNGRVLLSWVILNPNGPTINCLGIASDEDKSDQTEVFWRWMHFLGGESYCLGYIDKDSQRFAQELFGIFRHALTLETGPALKRCPLVTCVPSFFMALGGSEWNESFAAHLAETRAFREADWGRELYYLSKYGYQFFDRSAEEIREVYERLRKDPEHRDSDYLKMTERMHSGKPGFDNWRPNRYESRSLRAGDVEAWCKAVTSEEFQTASNLQLAHAWVGASHQVSSTMPATTTLEDVRGFLEHFDHAHWPEDWTTESVARDMGLSSQEDTRSHTAGAVDPEPTPSDQGEDFPLQLRLKLDFGVDLPISGGGGKKIAPIVVSTSTLQEAVDVQMQVHRYLGIGRRIAWRLESTEVSDPASKLVRAGLETLVFTEDEVTSCSEALYFVFDAFPAGATAASLPVPTGFRDPNSGLKLPHQLGWLHLHDVTDYERQTPGLGCSASYGGLNVKMTVYVYPSNCPPDCNGIDSHAVRTHFEQAIQDALKMIPKGRVMHRGTVPDGRGAVRLLAATLQLEDPVMSYVMLTARHGYFIKVRITRDSADRKINKTMWESIRALMDVLYPEAAEKRSGFADARRTVSSFFRRRG